MLHETFLSTPFLPDSDVTLMLVDGRISEIMERRLKDKGVRIIKTEALPQLPSAISYHPDIMVYHMGDNVVVVAPNVSQSTMLSLEYEGFEVVYGANALKSNYPYDIAYNIARIGNNVMHRFKYTDPIAHALLKKQGLKFIDVKQGYTKCSVLVVDENSIITEDIGIAKAASKEGLNVLLIEKGYVMLPGMNYGFIGGCGGLISKSVMAFAGDISLHPDYIKIKKFMDERSIDIYNLADTVVQDLGSLIPLKQCEYHKAAV